MPSDEPGSISEDKQSPLFGFQRALRCPAAGVSRRMFAEYGVQDSRRQPPVSVICTMLLDLVPFRTTSTRPPMAMSTLILA